VPTSKVAHPAQSQRLVQNSPTSPKRVIDQMKRQPEPKTLDKDRRRNDSFLSELDTRPNKWRKITEAGDVSGFRSSAFGRVEGIKVEKDAISSPAKGKKKEEERPTDQTNARRPKDLATARGLEDPDKLRRLDRTSSRRRVDSGPTLRTDPSKMPDPSASTNKGIPNAPSSKHRNAADSSTKRSVNDTPSSSTSKRAQKDTTKQPLDNYAEYKGRGRYAPDKPGYIICLF
jgi:hypothetical protein